MRVVGGDQRSCTDVLMKSCMCFKDELKATFMITNFAALSSVHVVDIRSMRSIYIGAKILLHLACVILRLGTHFNSLAPSFRIISLPVVQRGSRRSLQSPQIERTRRPTTSSGKQTENIYQVYELSITALRIEER